MNSFLQSLIAAGALLGAAPCLAVPIDRVMVTGDLADAVAVHGVTFDGNEIVGELINRSGYTISDVRVVAADSFRWADERNPGTDDPSRATAVTIPGPLAPNAAVSVRAPLPPRPRRDDGHFVPRIDVVGLVRIENPAPPMGVPAMSAPAGEPTPE